MCYNYNVLLVKGHQSGVESLDIAVGAITLHSILFVLRTLHFQTRAEFQHTHTHTHTHTHSHTHIALGHISSCTCFIHSYIPCSHDTHSLHTHTHSHTVRTVDQLQLLLSYTVYSVVAFSMPRKGANFHNSPIHHQSRHVTTLFPTHSLLSTQPLAHGNFTQATHDRSRIVVRLKVDGERVSAGSRFSLLGN